MFGCSISRLPYPYSGSAVDFSGRRSLLSVPCSPISAPDSAVDLSSLNFFTLCSPIPNPHSPVNLSDRRSFLPYPYSSLPCQPLSPSLFAPLSLLLTPLSTSQFVALCSPIPNSHSPVNLSVRRSFLPYP